MAHRLMILTARGGLIRAGAPAQVKPMWCSGRMRAFAPSLCARPAGWQQRLPGWTGSTKRWERLLRGLFCRRWNGTGSMICDRGSSLIWAGANLQANHVVSAAMQVFCSSLALSSLDGSNGFRLDGIDQDDVSGWSVALRVMWEWRWVWMRDLRSGAVMPIRTGPGTVRNRCSAVMRVL
jgi:hypothetical protein